MTRKTWPLLLGSFVVPALLIAACSSGGDEDEEYEDDNSTGNQSNTTRTSSGNTGNTAKNGSGGANNPRTGQGGNRFTGTYNTALSTAGGVLARGGASAGGRSGLFNQGGSTPDNKAGASGSTKPQNLAGNAGKPNTNVAGASGNGSGGAATGGASGAANGGASGAGNTTGVAGSTGNSATCPNGCAAISVPVEGGERATYSFEIGATTITSSTQLTVIAKIYAPGAAGTDIRLLVDDSSAATNYPCTSADVTLTAPAASGFVTITQDFTCASITEVTSVGIRIANGTTATKTYTLYVESLKLQIQGGGGSTWLPLSSTSVDLDGPGNLVLGPVGNYAGDTITCQVQP